MAQQKRDLLDEIIDIQADWNALSHTGDDLVNQFTSDPDDAPFFDPDDYKERPRANSTQCVAVSSKNADACHLCMDVCPMDAIAVNGASVRIDDACNKCGLCVGICPTEVFQLRKNGITALYDKIARVAAAYEQCYITCTRAIGRLPLANEIVLPCVGLMSRELWFDLLCEFPNLSAYLPLGICDKCQTSTGEEVLGMAIADAEEWSGESVGLEVDEADLVHEQSRAYKRSQFVSSVTQAGTRLVSRATPALAGAQAVANRLRNHSKQITELQKALDRAVGSTNVQNKRRVLTRRRRLLMAGLQKYPDLADDLFLEFPEVDMQRCTMCGDCVKACTLRALEMDKSGRVLLEPAYCANCGACAVVCSEDALHMRLRDARELVVPDEEAEERRRKQAQVRERAKKTLDKGLGVLESMAEEDAE